MDVSRILYGDRYELKELSHEHSTGTLSIDGRTVKYIKGDLDRPLPTAAGNADGSKSPPVEKNHFITVFIPEAFALVTVNYKSEASTNTAFAILQSLKVVRPAK